jgi:hypothetical protein
MRRVDRLVAVIEIGARGQREQFVGTGAANNPAGIQPERFRDRLAQIMRGAIRIVVQRCGDPAIGLNRLRARAERRLVRGKFVHLRDTRRMAAARHIGIDLHDAVARLWAKGQVGNTHRYRPWNRN